MASYVQSENPNPDGKEPVKPDLGGPEKMPVQLPPGIHVTVHNEVTHVHYHAPAPTQPAVRKTPFWEKNWFVELQKWVYRAIASSPLIVPKLHAAMEWLKHLVK